MLLYVLVGLLLLLFLFNDLINNNRNAKLIRKIPGLKDHFLIGNAWHALVPPENLKWHKYANMDMGYIFVPFGVETLGPWGPSAHQMFRDLVKRLFELTGYQNAGSYLAQKISLAIQLGNAASIRAEFFALGRELAASFNGIYRFYTYLHSCVNIYNPEDVEIVLSSMKHHEKSQIYTFLAPWLGEGLLLSSGHKWQHRRKILTPAFHFSVLRQYFTVLNENAERLVQTLEKVIGEPTNLSSVITEYTINSICESAMGIRLDTERATEGIAYKNAVHKIGNILFDRFVRVYLYSDFIFKYTNWGRQQEKVLSVIRNFTGNIIKKRKIDFQNGKIYTQVSVDNSNDLYINNNNKKNKMAMLDLLIAAERDGLIDEVGIQEEVDTFMFEGHDTTAAGLVMFLMILANNPVAQEKAALELQEIFGNTTRKATMEDFNKMLYLERCIKESLRLYPPVPFISRRLSESVKLSNYTVPEGTICHIHIYDLHRRADVFPDPLKFDPDRFLPENSIGRHNFAYIPFSAGPRNCIGQKFAMMEMKSAISGILRNFELLPVTTPEDIKMKSDIVLRSDHPIYVKFNKRNNILNDATSG